MPKCCQLFAAVGDTGRIISDRNPRLIFNDDIIERRCAAQKASKKPFNFLVHKTNSYHPWRLPRWMYCNCSGTFRHRLLAVYRSIPEVHGRVKGGAPCLWPFVVLPLGQSQVWGPNPTWGNHPKIFQRAMLEYDTWRSWQLRT